MELCDQWYAPNQFPCGEFGVITILIIAPNKNKQNHMFFEWKQWKSYVMIIITMKNNDDLYQI